MAGVTTVGFYPSRARLFSLATRTTRAACQEEESVRYIQWNILLVLIITRKQEMRIRVLLGCNHADNVAYYLLLFETNISLGARRPWN